MLFDDSSDGCVADLLVEGFFDLSDGQALASKLNDLLFDLRCHQQGAAATPTSFFCRQFLCVKGRFNPLSQKLLF